MKKIAPGLSRFSISFWLFFTLYFFVFLGIGKLLCQVNRFTIFLHGNRLVGSGKVFWEAWKSLEILTKFFPLHAKEGTQNMSINFFQILIWKDSIYIPILFYLKWKYFLEKAWDKKFLLIFLPYERDRMKTKNRIIFSLSISKKFCWWNEILIGQRS